jgi:uncharacterized small protein (DUF1192 family)
MSNMIPIKIAELALDAKDKEIALLKAEVERLTAFTTRTIIPNEVLQAEVKRLTEDNQQLQARCNFLEDKPSYE